MRVLVLLLLLVSVAAAAWRIARLRPAPDDIIEAEIAGRRFSFRAALARDEATRSGGLADRLAFTAVFPDFSPRVRARSETTARGDDKLVFVTISARDEAIDPADRPARLYARFLESEISNGPGGLILRRFEHGSPYELEQLYIAPPDGRAFFARCLGRDAGRPAYPAVCLWVLRWKTLDVELRFAPTLLGDWDLLVEGANRFLHEIDASDAVRRSQ